MRKIFGSMLFFLMVLGFGNLVSAEEQPENKDMDKVKQLEQYIEDSKVELNNIIESLKNENVYLEDVEEAIDRFYDENPIQEVVPNYKETDILLLNNNVNNNYNNSTIDVNELASDFKNNLSEGSSYHKISNDLGFIEVFVANDGSIMILDHSDTYTESLDETNVELSSWKQTPKRRTTAVGYNLTGGKLFTFWAEGQFSYNGSRTNILHADGDAQRHAWAYNMSMEERGLGRTRDSGYAKEVYSRIYVEARLGFTFMDIPLTAATLEVYIGGAPAGSTYGGARRI